MVARRLVPLCTLTAAGLVIALAAPAGAHEGPVQDDGVAAAAPATEGNGAATSHVANLQYAPLAGNRDQLGSDIEFLKLGGKEYALAGTLRNGMQIVDITDPTQPVLAGTYECPVTQGDIQVFRQGSRVLATYTADAAVAPTDNQGKRSELNEQRFNTQCVSEVIEQQPDFTGNELGTFLVDVTDPTTPTTVSFIPIKEGSHNQTVHPSGDYLYNSNSDLLGLGGLPEVTIHDISDPAAPRLVQNFRFPPVPTSLGTESHDIFFNRTGTRAYVAALSSTLILDTSDPEAPRIVEQLVDPSIELVHQSDLVSLPRQDGSVRDLLVITDEQAGAVANPTCPGGGLHVYDITGDLETKPAKLGTWFIPSTARPEPGGACTSHVLRMYPDQQLMTIAWYDQGVRTLDISGLAEFKGSPSTVARGDGVGMKEVGSFVFPDSDTWSFKTNRIGPDGSFFGYGNDIFRGLDVYRFDGGAAELGRPVAPLEPEDLAAPGCAGVPAATGYTDRQEARDVHQRSLDCVIARAIAVGSVEEGQRSYAPTAEVTRGQMATFILNTLRAAGIDHELPEPAEGDAFSDIAESPHRASINVLAAAGIVSGGGDGTFGPDALVERAQMATFVVKAADFVIEPDLASTGGARFTDVPAGSTHAASIETGADNALFSGVTATTFAPDRVVQRDQMASFLVNLLNRIDR